MAIQKAALFMSKRSGPVVAAAAAAAALLSYDAAVGLLATRRGPEALDASLEFYFSS
jgi:hypothetical protein